MGSALGPGAASSVTLGGTAVATGVLPITAEVGAGAAFADAAACACACACAAAAWACACWVASIEASSVGSAAVAAPLMGAGGVVYMYLCRENESER